MRKHFKVPIPQASTSNGRGKLRQVPAAAGKRERRRAVKPAGGGDGLNIQNLQSAGMQHLLPCHFLHPGIGQAILTIKAVDGGVSTRVASTQTGTGPLKKAGIPSLQPQRAGRATT